MNKDLELEGIAGQLELDALCTECSICLDSVATC